jgi:hypothetical protein
MASHEVVRISTASVDQGKRRSRTSPHHLRGAARKMELPAKVGQFYPRSKTVAAPPLVHALIGWPA